jgi:hypothetical protein
VGYSVTMPHTSVDTLNEARRRANRLRSTSLVLVADGLLTPIQFVDQSGTASGAPLRRTTLFQLLMNQPGWGRVRARAIVNTIADVTGVRPDVRKITVGWAIDPRAHGRHYQALVDSLTPKATDPWPGFPLQRGPRA